jgi:hypothetical protein
MTDHNTDEKEILFENLLNQIKDAKENYELKGNEIQKAFIRNDWVNLILKALVLVDTSIKAEKLIKFAPSSTGYITKTIRERLRLLTLSTTTTSN